MKKSFKLLTLFVIFIFITSGFLSQINLSGVPSTQLPDSQLQKTYTPQANRFLITDNSHFDIVDSGGDGSEGNPWIIEGWIWNIWSLGYAIGIIGTTDHFIIRDCYIYGFYPQISKGIYLENTINGRIEDCIFAAFSVYLAEGGNPVPPYGFPSLLGIEMINSNYIEVVSNDFVYEGDGNFYYGIKMDNCDHNTITGNVINAYHGLHLTNCELNTITGNFFTGKTYEVDTAYIKGETRYGIWAWGSHYNTIELNYFKRDFRLEYCVENTILENLFDPYFSGIVQEISCTSNYFIQLLMPGQGWGYTGPSGPEAGFYPDSKSFELATDGIEPMSYTGSGTGRFAKIVANKTDASGHDHKKVLQCYSGVGSSNTLNITDFFEGQDSGTLEFWMLRSDSGSGNLSIELLNNWEQSVGSIVMYDAFFYQDNVSLVDTNVPAEHNKWYRISIDYAAGETYRGLAFYQYRFIIYDSDGRNVLYKSPNINFRFANLPSTVNYYLSPGAGETLSVFLDALGYSWDYLYEIGDNRQEGMWLGYKMQFDRMYYQWRCYELDGQLHTLDRGSYLPFRIIPRPTTDGSHQIKLIGHKATENKTSATHTFTTSYYDTYCEPISHTENFIAYPPGQVLLNPTEDLNVSLTFKTRLGKLPSTIDTWANASYYYKISSGAWNGPIVLSNLTYGMQTVNFSLDDALYNTLDHIYYYMKIQQFDNSSRYLDTFYLTQEGVERNDEYAARENAFHKKIAPIPYELTLDYSVWYKAQIEAIVPSITGQNTTIYPFAGIIAENITLNFYNVTSLPSDYNIECVNNSRLDHFMAEPTSNISTPAGPQFNLTQGIKSPFLLPFNLTIPVDSNITVPEIFYDDTLNLTFTGNLLNLTYRGIESGWPYPWRSVMKFSSPGDDIIVRYDSTTRIMIYTEYKIGNMQDNNSKKLVIGLIDNNCSYPINLDVEKRIETVHEGFSVIPNHLLLILYDPPGDHSYSELKSGTTLSWGITLNGEIMDGYSFETETLVVGVGGGYGESSSTTVSGEYDTELEITFGKTLTSSLESENASFIGPGKGDLYHGGGLLVQYWIRELVSYILLGNPLASNPHLDDLRVWNGTPYIEYGLQMNTTFSHLGAYLANYNLTQLAAKNIFADNVISPAESQYVEKVPESPFLWTPGYYQELFYSQSDTATETAGITIEISTSDFFSWYNYICLSVAETVGFIAGVSIGTSSNVFEYGGSIVWTTELSFTTIQTSSTETNQEIVCHFEDDDGSPVGQHDQFVVDVYRDLRYNTFGYIFNEAFTFTSRPYEIYGVAPDEIPTRDRRPPTVSTLYGIDEFLHGTVTLNTAAVDEETGIDYVRFYYDNDPIFDPAFDSIQLGYQDNVSGTPNIYQLVWNTTTIPSGTYYLFAVAYDKASPVTNYLISDAYELMIDNILPSTCQARAYGPYFGAISLYANVFDADSGIAYVEYWDGNPDSSGSTFLGMSSDSSNSYKFTWATDPSGTDNGGHYICARAYDRAGNYQDSALFEVDVVSQAPMSPEDITMLILLGALVGIASVLTVMIWKTRQPAQAPPIPPKLKGALKAEPLEKPPLDILKYRLAQGDISQAEYVKHKKLLEE